MPLMTTMSSRGAPEAAVAVVWPGVLMGGVVMTSGVSSTMTLTSADTSGSDTLVTRIVQLPTPTGVILPAVKSAQEELSKRYTAWNL